MPYRNFIDIDILLVVLVNTLGLIISWVTTKEILSVIALIISIAYTIWKWNRDHKKQKK